MPLYQNSVLRKHLASQDGEAVKAAYAKYAAYFLDKEVQENIRNANEEQFQQKFLIELFVNVFGYVMNPDAGYNLTTELKNIKDAKKTDGAILTRGHDPLAEPKAIAVIELKGTDTKDLSKVNDQAFNYKNNQPDCVYVITSNFEKLRFFIHNAVEHEEFNLFTLTEERFALMWLFLQKDNLLGGIPAKVKEESLLQEDKITKALYADYSAFKNDLWNNMVEGNPHLDPLLLYKKSQKLLDRFLFIFFAEDKGLLPPNSISAIVEQWQKLKELDEYRPLYDRFKKYFGYMNIGHKGAKHEIHAYNGGLFKADELLDGLLIDDELLKKHCIKLTNYDFADEVDTNILGHIFEHSLNDIENVRAQLAGEEVDKSKTKRKKDGVFYTPKYITKYIVDNTVGKLCEEKKAEIGIDEEEFAKDRKGRKKATIKKLDAQLKQYRAWLLQLTICDPACGSGAFLNQALEFLMAEHRYVDELEAQLFEGSIVFQDVENHILENNIYGVDINEESVEIARLSLWLRTAQKGRKLTSLSSNIKCGNSLIDDPEVAGDLAFNWQKEFPNVFKEKDKYAYHITTATHDSRTSQRMIDHKVRQKRDNGARPYPEAIWLEPADEEVIMETLAGIVKEDKLHVLAANICGDHLHLLLVCEEEEVPKIVKKIKGRTSRMLHLNKGIYPLADTDNKELSNKGFKPLVGIADTTVTDSPEKERSKSIPLWTQKFGCKEITDQEQLENTIDYIQRNRTKHELPANKTLQKHIDSLVCSYEQAFATEYKGGFDVVIGNPPYVRQELIAEFKPFFEKTYKTYSSTADLYTYFIEMGIDKLIHDEGIYSIIVGNKWMRARFATNLRLWMKEKEIIELIDFGDLPVFENVAAYPVIVTLKKKTNNSDKLFYGCEPKNLNFDDLNLLVQNTRFKVDATELQDEGWSLVNKDVSSLISKLKQKGKPFDEFVGGVVYRGIVTGFNEAFVIDATIRKQLINEDARSAEIIQPFLAGRDIKRYYLDFEERYIIFTRRGISIDDYPAVKTYLEMFREKLEPKPKDWKGNWPGRKPGPYKWYEIQDSIDYYKEFEKPKIIYPNICIEPQFCLDEESYYTNQKCFIIPDRGIEILGVLNSSLYFFLFKQILPKLRGGYFEPSYTYLKDFPLLEFTEQNQLDVVTKQIALMKDIKANQNSFLELLQSKFDLPKPSTKLKAWPSLDFKGFLAELKKGIKHSSRGSTRGLNPLLQQENPLSLEEEAEWMAYFNKKKAEANALQSEIDRIDKEIDAMVYQLYGLTDEEIAIVENA